jgi:GNAT superfamily N-acetyltransferase
MRASGLRIARVPITHPDAAVLVAAVQAYYATLYGNGDETPIEPGYFDPPMGSFFVGYDRGRAVASGAWRFRPDVAAELGLVRPAEIKRMYVVPDAQRLGHARRMLAHLEETARAAGATDMVLETGAPQAAAVALYEASGYTPVPPFGHYRWSRLNRCYARHL